MIVIKAEMWPGGNAQAARTLFEAMFDLEVNLGYEDLTLAKGD